MYNLWYDNIGINNLVNSNNVDRFDDYSFITYRCTLLQTLKTLSITNFKINDPPFTCETNVYPISLGYYQSEKIKTIKIDEIQNFYNQCKNYNSEILLFYPHECFIIDNDSLDFLERLHNAYKELRIKLVSCNLSDNLGLPNYVTHVAFDYFRETTPFHVHTKIRPLLSIEKECTKDFLLVNARFRVVRALIYHQLTTLHNLTNAISTLHNYTEDDTTFREDLDFFIQSSTEIDKEYLNKNFNLDRLYKWFDNLYYNRKPVSLWKRIDRTNDFNRLYQNTYLDVINETFFDSTDNVILITEKTYRAIAYGMIFLICGQTHTIRHLKNVGFNTFDDLFDESYDNKTHWSERWEIIKQNIKLWTNLSAADKKIYYKKSYDKLVHNQNLVYQTTVDNIKDILYK